MSKYFSIFKMSFKQESKTLSNTLTASVSFLVIIYIFMQLWAFIYGGNGGGTLIEGYTLEMMIWYMIMGEILMYAVNARATCREFSSDIKSGKIAYQLNKPYNYYFYQVTKSFSENIFKLIFMIPSAIFIGLVLLGPIQNFTIEYIVPILFSTLLGVFLTGLIYGFCGLFAFWVEEASPFAWIIQKFQMLFGLFFPPELFPAGIQTAITYSPVFAMISGPSKLLANFSWDLFWKVGLSQVVYVVVFFVFGIIVYNLGTKKVNINGG